MIKRQKFYLSKRQFYRMNSTAAGRQYVEFFQLKQKTKLLLKFQFS